MKRFNNFSLLTLLLSFLSLPVSCTLTGEDPSVASAITSYGEGHAFKGKEA